MTARERRIALLTQVIELCDELCDGNHTAKKVYFKGFITTVPVLYDKGSTRQRIWFKALAYKQVKGERLPEWYDVTIWCNDTEKGTVGYKDVEFFQNGAWIKVFGEQHQYKYENGKHGVELSAQYVELIKNGGE